MQNYLLEVQYAQANEIGSRNTNTATIRYELRKIKAIFIIAIIITVLITIKHTKNIAVEIICKCFWNRTRYCIKRHN